TLPNIRIFCWRIGHDILPTYEKISTIRRDFNSDCPRCGRDKETLIHALKDCPRARAVLIHGGLNSNLLDSSHCRGVDWIEEVARSLDVKALSDFVTVLWNIWNSRNKKVFWNMEEDAKVTWERAAALSHDFRIFNMLKEPSLLKPAVKKGWRKSNQGMVKINFDTAVKYRKSSFGIIARDHDGFVLGVPGGAPAIHPGGAPANCPSGAAANHSGSIGPWSCGASGTIGTLVLGCGRASDTIDNLSPWSCKSLGHHRYLGAKMCGSLRHHRITRPLVVQEPRAPSAPGRLYVREPQTLSTTLVLGCARASSTIGTLVPAMCGLKKSVPVSDSRMFPGSTMTKFF
ncbi:hypothetical protein Godav_010056, partial [Gossypium davidsonii]|nr:hypothetical protein [Gossypium davidsonii]